MIIVFHSQNDGSTLLHNLFNQMDIDLNGFLSMTEAEAVLKAMDANGRDSRLTFFYVTYFRSVNIDNVLKFSYQIDYKLRANCLSNISLISLRRLPTDVRFQLLM